MSSRRKGFAAALVAAVFGLPAATASAAEPPRRIVSLNLCADQLLMLMVPRERVAALTYLAGDPDVSAMAAEGKTYPGVRSEAEEVLGFDPDLVIDGEFTARPTADLLQRLGRRVERIGMSSDVEGIRANVRRIAELTDSEVAGGRVLAELDRRLAVAAPRPGEKRPTALVYFLGGLVAGRETLADAALSAAGFDNLATVRGVVGLGAYPMEALIAAPPDLLVLGNGAEEYATVAADNLRHPALARLLERIAHVSLPPNLLVCDTPHLIDAIERLAAARRRLNGAGMPLHGATP